MRRAFRLARPTSAVLSACVSLLLLSACTKPAPETTASTPPAVTSTAKAPNEPSNELKWARLALARNPTLEIIATDTAAGVFTVRFKDSGEVRAVKLDELAAAPIAALRDAPARMAATPEAAPTPAAMNTEERVAAPGAPAATMSSGQATMAQATPTSSNYTIERADGQVKVSGPGVSIVSSGTNTVSATAGDSQQRTAEPIICEGRRMLHFDNRNIYVEGDAIIARGGCELYITNSRVVADGTGVIVRDAVVHIANSTIEGGAASFDADDTAKVYVRSSTFQGLPRRTEHATVQDQGGNQWR